jgi:hypothetical protein
MDGATMQTRIGEFVARPAGAAEGVDAGRLVARPDFTGLLGFIRIHEGVEPPRMQSACAAKRRG